MNVAAERGVIGSILLAPDTLYDFAETLREEDFHDPANGVIYRHLLAMHESGGIDLMRLFDRLKETGELEFVGGAKYIQDTFESVPHAAHAKYYAQVVRQHSARGGCNEVS